MKQSSTTATRGKKSTSASGRKSSSTSGNSSRSGNTRNTSQGSRSSQGVHSNGKTTSEDEATMQRTTGSSRGNQKRNTGQQEGQFEGTSHLEKFFLDQLQDIYYAEQKIVQSLPKLRDAATTEELREAFEDHLHQSERHVKRLEKVFQTLNKKAEGKKCEAIEGITREVEQIIGETEEGTMTRDAALIIAAQKVEHYEIATYGGLVQLAITMQLHDAADLLDKTLMEEEDTDSRLTEIAENEVNLGADHENNQYSWDQQHAHSQEEEENEEDEEDQDENARHL